LTRDGPCTAAGAANAGTLKQAADASEQGNRWPCTARRPTRDLGEVGVSGLADSLVVHMVAHDLPRETDDRIDFVLDFSDG
jgi:hypothetical protein